MIRLSAAGAAALDGLLAGELVAGAEALGRRLRGHGLVHPLADHRVAAVTFVIPVRDGGTCLPALAAKLGEWGPVIVVDDGSRDGAAELAGRAGAAVIANDRSPGPAGARNAGLAAAETEFVAFLDADCACRGDWARPLAALLAEDPELAIVAPRVRGAVGENAIARYEISSSPLDMGPYPGLVGPGRRIGFVPSAALVARREMLLELGGFDEALRFGEDVDLVWRAIVAGWSVRYAPELQVDHRPRPTLRALARQRFEYGGSAARLDSRHPGAVAPLRVDGGALAVWLSALALGARAGGTVAVGLTARAAFRQPDMPAALAITRLSVLGQLHTGRQLARAATRDWLPVTIAAALLSRRARRAALAALAVDVIAATGGKPRLALPRFALLRVLDNASYSLGLWRGALRERSFAALLPRSSSGRRELTRAPMANRATVGARTGATSGFDVEKP
jgi:mycofactocin system glycosyltransferase